MPQNRISRIALWLVIFSLFAGACKQFDKLTQFTVEYEETFVIPSSIGINLPFNIYSPPIKTNSREVFEIENTRKDLVEEVKLEQLQLSIVEPADGDFSFLKSIEIYVAAEGLEEILVAWKYDIKDTQGNSLILETSEADLTDYIVQDEFTLRFTTVTDKLVLSDHELEVNASFFVDARILGI